MARYIDVIQDDYMCEFFSIDEQTRRYLVELEDTSFIEDHEEYKE